jgi:hypothetical protein
MKPRQLGGLRAFAAGLATLGGALALLGSRAPETGAVPQPLTPLAGKSLCEQFFKGDKGKGGDHEGPGKEKEGRVFKLTRNKNYKDIQLAKGEFVGAVEDTTKDNSDTFPELKAGQKGCIWFWRRVTGTQIDQAAYFYHFDGGPPRELQYKLYCPHVSSSNPKRKPEWLPIPDDCPTAYMTVGATTVLISRPAGLAWASAESAILSALTGAGMDPAIAAAAARWTVKSGPWYPCDPNGCCRAG